MAPLSASRDGDGALVDAGVVERQRAGRVDRNLAGVVVDGAVQIDGQRAAGQHLDGAGVGDVVVVERIAGVGDVDRAVIVEGAVREHPVAGQVERADGGGGVVVEDVDGALVDGGVVERQRAERVDRDGAGVVVDGAVQIDGQRAAGQHLDVLGVGDDLVVERIAGVGDVDRAVIVEGAVREHPVAGQMQRAHVAGAVVVEHGDGAVVDRGGVDGHDAERVDRDVAAGVVDGAGQIDGQRAVRQHLDGAGVGDGLVVERIAGAADVDGAGIVERAVGIDDDRSAPASTVMVSGSVMVPLSMLARCRRRDVEVPSLCRCRSTAPRR